MDGTGPRAPGPFPVFLWGSTCSSAEAAGGGGPRAPGPTWRHLEAWGHSSGVRLSGNALHTQPPWRTGQLWERPQLPGQAPVKSRQNAFPLGSLKAHASGHWPLPLLFGVLPLPPLGVGLVPFRPRCLPPFAGLSHWVCQTWVPVLAQPLGGGSWGVVAVLVDCQKRWSWRSLDRASASGVPEWTRS